MLSAAAALERLKDGNRRFVECRLERAQRLTASDREDLVGGQSPFAVIVGCADSRVPPEVIFDQTLGDLFVIRVAGNIATPAVTGSVEFAAGQLGTRLVVVLGHSGCGAIQATLAEVDEPSNDLSPGLGAIVNDIVPVVRDLPPGDQDREEKAIRSNIMNTVRRLTEQSELLAALQRDDGLTIVGARYSLETGEAGWFSEQEYGGRLDA